MGAIFTLLLPVFSTLIDKIFPDPKQAADAQLALTKVLNEAQAEAFKAQAIQDQAKKDIIVAEITKQSFASNWRAYLMIMCSAIVGYNWVIVSLLNAFLTPLGTPIVPIPVPAELWTLLTIGLGGYIGKETMQTYTQAKVEKARVESASINEEVLARKLRETLFKDGMSEAQWSAIRDSAHAAATGAP